MDKLNKTVTLTKRLAQKTQSRLSPIYLIPVAVLLFFGSKALAFEGDFIGGIDIAKYSFWNAIFTKAQLLSGSLPLWNPHYYSGHPFMANPQTFTFYPFSLLFVALPLPWAFNINTVAHIVIAGLGIYLFVGRFVQFKAAALTAAIIYCLSGYFMDTLYAGHFSKLHTAAIAPWIFYFIERGWQDKKPQLFAVAGAVLGVQILSGGPQNNLYTAIFLTLYFALRALTLPSRDNPFPIHKRVLFFPLIPLAALLIGAIQILPSAEFILLSDRADNTYEFATYFSFPPDNLFTLLVPKPQTRFLNTNWELGGYFGILALVLAVVGALFAKQRRVALIMVVMSAFALTIMLGSHTFLYWYYYNWIPGLAVYRIPARCIVVVVFAMATLAGLGLDRLCREPLPWPKHAVAPVLAITAAALIWWGAGAYKIPLDSGEMLLAFGLCSSALVITALAKWLKNPHLIAVLVALGCFGDLYLSFADRVPILNEQKLLTKTASERELPGDIGFYRVASGDNPSRAMAFGYYGINGRTPIAMGSYYQFMHQMAGVRVPKNRRHALNRSVMSRENVLSSKILAIKYARSRRANRLSWRKAPDPLPRASLVGHATILPALDDHIARMKQPTFDPRQTILLDKAPPAELPDSRRSEEPVNIGSVEITDFAPNSIALRAQTNEPGFLLLSELYYPGWLAIVNGTEQPILRANYLLRAIQLPQGKHDISFLFRPTSLIVGAALTLMGLVLFALYWWFSTRVHRRRR